MAIKKCFCSGINLKDCNAKANSQSLKFQEKTYGQGMRVFTSSGKAEDGTKERCSICGKSEGDFKKK